MNRTNSSENNELIKSMQSLAMSIPKSTVRFAGE